MYAFTLDASGDIKDSTGAAAYARGFVVLSASKSCSEIETTITLPKDDNVVEATSGKSVIGLAFDVHVTKDAEGKEFYDFILVGVQPKTGYYYVEKYENIAKADLKDSMNTNDGANAGTYTRDLTEKETASKAKKAVGQVFMYGNAPSAADFFYSRNALITLSTSLVFSGCSKVSIVKIKFFPGKISFCA